MRFTTGMAVSGLVAGLVLGGCAAQPTTTQAKKTNTPRTPATTPLVESSIAREDAIDLLVKESQGDSALIRANAIEALEHVPGRLDEVVERALRDSNEGVRTVATMVVGRARMVRHAIAVDALRDDPSPFVRASAIYALRRAGDATRPLAGLLLDHPNARVRAHTAFILGELGERSAMPLLKTASISPAPRATAGERRLLELQISEAMIKLGDEGELQTIRAALYPSRPEQLETTALAVQIIGEVEDRGSIDQLIYLSAYKGKGQQEMPAEVRLAIADTLAKLGLRDGSFIADEYAGSEIDAVRAQSASVYGRTRQPENLSKLQRMMADPSGIVRVAAAAGVLEVTEENAERHAAHPAAVD
ncbi:MAG: HEAT repeat domain-containing protein [Phycisphaerales bacterium]